MNKRFEKSKNNKGITLVALVITIIVLLILAGVTLSMVLGPNDIISRSKDAKEQTEQAALNEQTMLHQADNFINEQLNEGENPEEPPKEISFIINLETYTAQEGMTWEEWVNSSYNNNQIVWQVSGSSISATVASAGLRIDNVTSTDVIIANYSYTYTASHSGGAID